MTPQEKLKEQLEYDPETGFWRWRKHKPNRKKGWFLGAPANGYLYIRFEGKVELAHRLAWLYMTGSWPEVLLDHRNKIKSDNRWNNLREADHVENMANSHTRKDNKSGFRGVSWRKDKGKWQVLIKAYGEQKYIGLFELKEDAIKAYNEVAREEFGEFFNPEESNLIMAMSFEDWCLLVKHHDLTYTYSDDGSVYRRGQAAYNLIVSEAAAFPRADVVRVWNELVDSFLIPAARPEFYWTEQTCPVAAEE